jgi:hypothetical protein
MKAPPFLVPALVLGLAVVAAPTARAQQRPGELANPGTYEGSMRLQREQAAQAQQQQDAMRQQQSAADQQWNDTLRHQQAVGAAQQAQANAVRRTWQARPALAADRNPLLGRWASQGAAASNAAATNQMARQFGPEFAALANAMVGNVRSSVCDSMVGRGTVEFRPNALVAVGAGGRERLLHRVEYRGGGTRVVVLPTDAASFTHMIVDFEGPDRAMVAGAGCVLARGR